MKKFVSFSLVAGTLGVMALHPASVQGSFPLSEVRPAGGVPGGRPEPPRPFSRRLTSIEPRWAPSATAISRARSSTAVGKSTGTAADRPRRLLVRAPFDACS